MTSDADIFARVVEGAPGDREKTLETACVDTAQRTRLEALLRAHEKAQRVLATPLHTRPEPVASEAGKLVGRYKLLEKIGEGGCGVVWMAQQEEPVRRRVALKIIKLGMDTKETIARFESERQALALMEHPNIARVLDAGATDTGRPYFVMELVRGLPITRYCDEQQLTTPQRLALFVQVCRAIQHAHERGIVHRDIKPSNVLVTREDGEPLPKVIDFGIAKAMQGRLTDRTLFTAFEQFVGTPAYMSPEQADFAAHEVDARSDVYSLGALLYELLAGRPPFDPKTLLAQSIEEVRRIIREVDPPRLSNQLHTLSRAERTTVAQRRGVAPEVHALAMRGDLDWIVMKALDKSRGRRYDSAAELAADVARHLEHKAVHARPPGRVYRATKFARRHRGPLAVAVAILCACALGATSLWQARRAARAEKARGRPVAAALASAKAARPAPPPPASPEALARARAFVADLRGNFFADCAGEAREDGVELRAVETMAAFDLIPLAQRPSEWKRDRAWAEVRQALAQRRQAKTVAVAQAAAICAELEALRQAGDTSEDAVVLLAIACTIAYEPIMPQRLYGPHPDAGKRAASLQRAADLLLPLALAPGASARVRHTLAEVLLARAESQNGEAGQGLLRQAQALLEGLDAATLQTDAALLTRAKIAALRGKAARGPENQFLQEEARALADSVLARQPRSAAARRVKVSAELALAELAGRSAQPAELDRLGAAERLAVELHAEDPSSDDHWYLLLVARRAMAGALIERGRIADAVAVLQQTAVDAGHPATQLEPVEGGSRRYIKGTLERIALLEAARGNFAAADRAAEAAQVYVMSLKVPEDASAKAALSRDAVAAARFRLQVDMPRGDYAPVFARAKDGLTQLGTLLAGPDGREADRVAYRSEVEYFREHLAEAGVHLGRFAEVEALLRGGAELRPRQAAPYTVVQRIWLALSVARQERGAEALELLAPALEFLQRQRDAAAAKFDQLELLARARFIEAVAQPATDAGRARRAAALGEAQALVDAMPAEARQLYNQRVLSGWLAAERTRR